MANTTICLYGRSGTYKTSQIGFLAQYIFEKTNGKILRLVSADGGGWKPIQPFIDAGLIEAFSIVDETNPIFLMHKLCQGYWPKNLGKDGKKINGIVDKNLSNVGGYVFEGITTIAERFLDHLAGKKLGMNPSYSLRLTSTGEDIITSEKGDLVTKAYSSSGGLVDENNKALEAITSGAYSQDHYGFVQKNIIEKLLLSWSLPVDVVMWTAHEAEGNDELDRSIIRGPAVVGKKGTPKIGRNVGALIHAESYTTSKVIPVTNQIGNKGTKIEEITEVRYNFMSHPDKLSNKIIWECKPRTPAAGIPELLKVFRDGYFVPTTDGGLDRFLKIEDQLLNKGTEDLLKWKKEMMEKMENKK